MRRTGARSDGFTLLEVIVAMGVLAIGATAAFALLVAATAAGRRAEHEVNEALIAETILNDTRLEEGVRLDDLPLASGTDPAPGATPPGNSSLSEQPQGAETRYLEHDQVWKAYPDYRYDVAITPLPDEVSGEVWSYLIEVEVRWSDKGRRRSALFSTVRLRTLTHRGNPSPRARR